MVYPPQMLLICTGKPPDTSNTALILNVRERERWSVRNRGEAVKLKAQLGPIADSPSLPLTHPTLPTA